MNMRYQVPFKKVGGRPVVALAAADVFGSRVLLSAANAGCQIFLRKAGARPVVALVAAGILRFADSLSAMSAGCQVFLRKAGARPVVALAATGVLGFVESLYAASAGWRTLLRKVGVRPVVALAAADILRPTEPVPVTSAGSRVLSEKAGGRLVVALAAAGILGFSSMISVGVASAHTVEDAEGLAANAQEWSVQDGFADLVESVSPAVVSVRVERKVAPSNASYGIPRNFGLPEGHPMEKFLRRHFRDRYGDRRSAPQNDSPRHRTVGQGSGFFISPDGYVVTNHHVIKDGERLIVVLHDGDEHEADLVGIDSKTDLALLSIDVDEPTPYVSFAEEDDLRVGDWVVAVGNPFGLGGTVTSGIVSGRGRDIGAGPYDDFIQIDAPINRGNSGGPTFDLDGEVVGVNSVIFSPSGGNVGIGFAIPASVAQGVIAELMENGAVSRGWLGVQVQRVDEDIAASLGLDNADGAIISEVVPDSPADVAGLRSGDVILGVGDEIIKLPRGLSRRIASLDAGADSDIRIWRDGREQTVSVAIGELPLEEVAMLVQDALENALGLTLEQTEEGIVVVAVDPDSEAARKNITVGDVIVSVGMDEVTKPEDFHERLKTARAEGIESILILLRRGDAQHYVALPVGSA